MKNAVRMWTRGVLLSAVLVLPAAALAVFGLGGPVVGAELSPAWEEISVFASTGDSLGGGQTQHKSGYFPVGTLITDYAVEKTVNPLYSYAYALASSSVEPSGIPITSLQGLAFGSVNVYGIGIGSRDQWGNSSSFSIGAYAAWNVFFKVRTTHDPPWLPSIYPIDVIVSGACETSMSGATGQAYGSVGMHFADGAREEVPGSYAEMKMANDTPMPTSTIDMTNIVWASLSRPMMLLMEVGITFFGGGERTATAAAYLDPTITFNQPAFNEYAASLGKTPYNLSDYFSCDVSRIQEILFDRGLPNYNGDLAPPSNLNGTSNANRSNFSFSQQYTATKPSTYQIAGDDFIIGNPGQTYEVNNIRVWMVYGAAESQYDTTTHTPPSFPLTLWVGPAGGSLQPLEVTPAWTRSWYDDGENFQRTSDGAWRCVWAIDIPVNLKINGGQKYQIFLDGLFLNNSGVWQSPPLCVANAGLSNNPRQEGADDQYLKLTLVDGVPSGAPGVVANRDANIQIIGVRTTPVTKPGSVAPLNLLLLD